jgi:hypothetical protein
MESLGERSDEDDDHSDRTDEDDEVQLSARAEGRKNQHRSYQISLHELDNFRIEDFYRFLWLVRSEMKSSFSLCRSSFSAVLL